MDLQDLILLARLEQQHFTQALFSIQPA